MAGPAVILRTDRLVLAPPASGDLADMCRLMADPDVMRWFDVCRPMSQDEVAVQLQRWLRHQEVHGFAPGPIRDASTGNVIGHGGLARYPETEDRGPELIYLFSREYWGRGLATEFARAVLAWGFRDLGVGRILSTARPENRASLRVLQKAGMSQDRWWPEVHRYLYSITAEGLAGRGSR